MKFSKAVEEIDNKSYRLCEECRSKLDNIREELNF